MDTTLATRPGRSRLQWLGIGGLLAAGCLAVLAAALVLTCAERLRAARSWVEHTNIVLTTVDALRESLLTAGIARRSYVITGDAHYLEEYAKERATSAAAFGRLSALVSDNRAQKIRISALRTEISRRWSEFDAELRDSKPGALAAAMRGSRGLSLYRQISSTTTVQFNAIRATETALLGRRERKTDVAQFWLLTFAASSVLMGLLAAGLSVYLLQRQRVAAQARELQLEILHMQRLGIMNQTSSVLAHEILHPLTAAQNYASILNSIAEGGRTDDTLAPSEIGRRLERQIQRAAEIVKRLRSFVGRGDGTRSAETVESLIGDAAELFEIVDRSIALETRIAPNLPPVLVDRVQIRQVMVNLMRNAVEAMRGRERRELTVSASRHSDAGVEIRLADSGKGLSADMARRLFEPFVGDKSDGLGLGLSICRSIVVAHGGRIWAEAAPGGGAVFCFTVPAAPTRWSFDELPGETEDRDTPAELSRQREVAEGMAIDMRTSS